MTKTIEICKNYLPYNKQETADKQYVLNAHSTFNGNLLTRENPFCHITCSAFVLNQNYTKVLCCFHNIYQSWGWVGGHADGLDDPAQVAKNEAMEETGIKNLTQLLPTPISLDVLVTEGHFKNNKFISGHTHINICYLFKANDTQPISTKTDENSCVKWQDITKLPSLAREPAMKIVYAKILEKVNLLKNRKVI